MKLAQSVLVTLLLTTRFFTPEARARELTFEERVRAQQAIERVHYAHQIGEEKPFEEMVPTSLLEKKVRTYLEQSAALDLSWNTPVSGAMLEREVKRMAQQTRMPERLRELFAALGNDAFLVQECLARPALVDRLARSFFASDDRLHDESRRRTDRLRELVVRRSIDPRRTGPRRAVVSYLLSENPRIDETASDQPGLRDGQDTELRELDGETFAARRERALGWADGVSGVGDAGGAFLFEVLLENQPRELRIASFSVAKMTWDVWWERSRNGFDPASVHAVAAETGSLPTIEGNSPYRAQPGTPCLPDDTWDNGALDDLSGARIAHTAVWTGSVMVVWGGYDYSSYLNTGGRYDPATDTWTPTSTLNAPSGRMDHAAVWTGSLMAVWGGYAGEQDPFLNTGGRYDPATDTWTPTSTVEAPAGRYDHTAVWTGEVMVVWGGSASALYPSTGGRYDPATDSWTPTSTVNAPAGREEHTAVWTGSVMVVWGGYAGEQDPSLNTGGRYDPVTDRWTATSTVDAPSKRSLHTGVWTGNLMVVWGGYAGEQDPYLNTGGRYDPATDSWTPTSTVDAPSGRLRPEAVWTGSIVWVWGGQGEYDGSYYRNTGGRYDPVADTWSPTSTVNAPAGRYRHSAVWTGSLVVVWGGYAGEGLSYVSTGGRYDPGTDTWTPTSSSPGGRYRHSAVWTGSLMVVWGGFDNLSRLNTGDRYDPATDSWTPTSTLNAPSPRGGHTAAWTGKLMVIWGGFDAAGGRYDPLSDTWAPISTVNAPVIYRRHTAVWTGSLMIVWGGVGSTFPSTGARYDPETDSWTPTSIVNAPSGRSLHTAVWTGTRMVVWGGGSGNSPSNTGGQYDPAADTWTPTSTVGAPSSRESHTAVWTGNSMVVWGGDSGSGSSLNTGGRYDPSADVWTPVSTVSAPASRSRHTAEWTGTHMIVWGGVEGLWPPVNTGGRYNPVADTWMPTSTVNAHERSDHTSVWTGTLMIVWGGFDPSSVLHTGARYGAFDADSDGAADPCDNCPASVNPGQSDTDVDGAGDVCDNCPEEANGGQNDFDADAIGDACENGAVLADANHSGRVDGFDLARLARSFALCVGTAGYDPTVDLDRSGCVNGDDLAVLAADFGDSVP